MSLRLPPVAEFFPSSLIEWEDHLSAVIALQGCNYRCPFCHSARLVRPGPPDREVPWDEVERVLARRAGWLDGVVVSGGEPTIHAGLGELLEALRALDLPVKLDTNGSSPARLEELVRAGLVQHVALDVKAPLDEAAYERATGRSGALAAVRESLALLRRGGVSCELRTTIWPVVFDERALLELARELAWAPAWFLQSFRPQGCLDPEAERLPPTDPDWLAAVARKCRAVAPGCRVRGETGASH